MKQKIEEIMDIYHTFPSTFTAKKILSLIKKQILKAGYDKITKTYSPDDIFEYVKRL